MDKLIYILWGPREQDREQRQQVLLKEVAPRLLEAGAKKLTMYIVDQDSDFKSAAPFHPGERMCADVSLWLDSLEQRAACEEIIKAAGFRLAGFLVDEVIYTEYGGNRHSGPRNWPDGQRSPGIVAVTLMERPKRLSPRRMDQALAREAITGLRGHAAALPLHKKRGGESGHPGCSAIRRHSGGSLALGQARHQPLSFLRRRQEPLEAGLEHGRDAEERDGLPRPHPHTDHVHQRIHS